MPLIEDFSASFIVRIWRETGGNPSTANEWRGSIEHVTSKRRRYFRDLGAIAKFMKPHLHELGIDSASNFWEVMSDEEADPLPEPKMLSPSPLKRPNRRKK